ncbi:hypothetical protein PENSPDRAFT_751336 [Peniophora sp. CONT]|nr:hypothetical protein PENSPDRAFT_751336 [Peniophora sp. CONT]
MNEQFQTLPDGHQELVRFQYSPGEDHATIVTVVVSVFELIASFGLLVAILLSAYNTRSSDDPRLFVRTHSAVFFICLVVCAVLQAIGGIMSAAWVREMAVVAGSLCTAQAVIKHISDVGVAVWSFVIAAHSFLLLWRAGGHSKKSREPISLLGYSISYGRFLKWSIIALTWLSIFIIVTLGPEITAKHTDGDFYGVSGQWCWITNNYPVERILLAYAIMFASAFLSLALYAGAFYHIRRRVHHDKPASEYILSNEDQADEYALKLSKYMVWYPLSYFCCLLPVAIQRFAVWGGAEVHFGAVVFTDSVYHLLGIAHLVLFVCTPRLLPPLTVFPAMAIFGTGAYENERAESYAHPEHTKQKHFVRARRPPPLAIAPLIVPVSTGVSEKTSSSASSGVPSELMAQERVRYGCGAHVGPSGRPGLPCRPGSQASSRSRSSSFGSVTTLSKLQIPPPIVSPSHASIRSLSSVSSELASTWEEPTVQPQGRLSRQLSRDSSTSSHAEINDDDADSPFADPLPHAKHHHRAVSGLPSHPAAAVHPRATDTTNLRRMVFEKSHWSSSTGTASTATATLSAYISTGTGTAGTYVSTANSGGSAIPPTANASAISLSGFEMVTPPRPYIAPNASMRIVEEENEEDLDEKGDDGDEDYAFGSDEKQSS